MGRSIEKSCSARPRDGRAGIEPTCVRSVSVVFLPEIYCDKKALPTSLASLLEDAGDQTAVMKMSSLTPGFKERFRAVAWPSNEELVKIWISA